MAVLASVLQMHFGGSMILNAECVCVITKKKVIFVHFWSR